MSKKFDIVAFGEFLIDFTYTANTDRGQKLFAQNPGGAPANVLVCGNKLGTKNAFVGKVGNDMHGRFLKETIDNEGIDTTGLILDDKYFTTLAFVDLNEHGERSFSFARKPGADTQMESSEMNLDVIQDCKIFHVGSLSLTDSPSKEATFYGIEKAKEAGAIISYDPNYRASLWASEEAAKEEMVKIIPDIMKISDEETSLLTPFQEPEKAALELLKKGSKVVIVTLGGDGALLAMNGETRIVPGFKCNVVDTTGAGDSFWGAILHQVAMSGVALEEISMDTMAEYIYYANAVASLCIEGQGAIPAMPTVEEVEKRIKRG